MTDETVTPSSPLPERARIDTPLASKRLDALPVLYLVGFVILAAALIYLWKHPSLPQGAQREVASLGSLRTQSDALSARIAQLEGRPAPAAPDLGPVQGRIAALEARPAPAVAPDLGPLAARVTALEGRALPPAVDLQPLEGRIAALEERPPPPVVDLKPLEGRLGALEGRPPVDLKPLEGRVAAAEGRPPVDLKPLEGRIAAVEGRPPVDLKPLEGRIAALEGKPPVDLGPLQAGLAGLAAKAGSDVAGLSGRLDRTDAQVAKGTTALASIEQRGQLIGKLQAASVALETGQRLGDLPGAPPALARFAHDNPPTQPGLRMSFDRAVEAAHRASQPALTDDQPFFSRVWTRAQQSVTVRQGDRVIVGDPISGVIEHARQLLDAGDLAGAVGELDALSGPAKAAMAGWVAQAQSLLDARAAIASMAARG